MTLLNAIKQQGQNTGEIEEVEIFKMENFALSECSSLNDKEKESPNGTFFIKHKPGRTKFFVKKGGDWYTLTTTPTDQNGTFTHRNVEEAAEV